MNKIELKKIFEHFKNKHILVIGDTIIDEYRHCEALGKSSEAPVLVVREQKREQYIGGAGIVSQHIMALGAQCSFLTVLGDDHLGMKIAEKIKFYAKYVFDNERPTTWKGRYMVDNQKLLRVSKLEEKYISEEIENNLISLLECEVKKYKIDVIVVSDFNYGVITKNILERIRELAFNWDIALLGDTQSSSQIGDVNQFQNYDLITPNEREARIALKDEHSDFQTLARKLAGKTFARNICLTLGKNGFITFFEGEHKIYKTLNNNPIDAVGAGDALLAAFAVAYGETDIWNASLIAQAMAGLKVSKVGNVPISADELYKEMEKNL